jgi:polysaccharide export outer membrane protein
VQVLDPSVVKVVLRRDGEVYQLGLETLRTNPDAREIVLIDGDQVQVQSTLPQDLAQTRRGQELEQRQLRVAEADYALRKRNREAEQEGVEASRLERERALFRERLEFGAVERDYAFIAGEVGGARRFPLPFENPATLSDLLLNGTPLNITTADYGAIYVIRAARDPALQDKLTAYHLDAENAVNLMIATEFELRPNDVVFVSEQPITRWNRAISQVLPNIFRAVSLATLGNGL